jgi:hypothetical protein
VSVFAGVVSIYTVRENGLYLISNFQSDAGAQHSGFLNDPTRRCSEIKKLPNAKLESVGDQSTKM